MFKISTLAFLIAESPVHPGSGSEIGIVDLPIQREKYTDFPKIESSSLKGSLRECFQNSVKEIKINEKTIMVKDKDLIDILFGPEGEETFAGALAITDAKILLFPVKSFKGVFAWVTCPLVLKRFFRNLYSTNCLPAEIKKIANIEIKENTLPENSEIIVDDNNVVLEEYSFKVKTTNETTEIANALAKIIFQDRIHDFWKAKLEKDFLILNNDDFRQFVKTSTEVITRTKIDDETGTVQAGALWTEEYLPQDTILYFNLMFSAPYVNDDSKKQILSSNSPERTAELLYEYFTKSTPKIIQVGGNQTIGKGFMSINILNIL